MWVPRRPHRPYGSWRVCCVRSSLCPPPCLPSSWAWAGLLANFGPGLNPMLGPGTFDIYGRLGIAFVLDGAAARLPAHPGGALRSTFHWRRPLASSGATPPERPGCRCRWRCLPRCLGRRCVSGPAFGVPTCYDGQPAQPPHHRLYGEIDGPGWTASGGRLEPGAAAHRDRGVLGSWRWPGAARCNSPAGRLSIAGCPLDDGLSLGHTGRSSGAGAGGAAP